MPSLDLTQISSLAASIDEAARRAADLGEHLEGPDTSDAASALYEAERSLRMAERAVLRATRALEG